MFSSIQENHIRCKQDGGSWGVGSNHRQARTGHVLQSSTRQADSAEILSSCIALPRPILEIINKYINRTAGRRPQRAVSSPVQSHTHPTHRIFTLLEYSSPVARSGPLQTSFTFPLAYPLLWWTLPFSECLPLATGAASPLVKPFCLGFSSLEAGSLLPLT